MTGLEILISRSSKRAGECKAGSTRLALWTEDEVKTTMTVWTLEDMRAEYARSGDSFEESCWMNRVVYKGSPDG